MDIEPAEQNRPTSSSEIPAVGGTYRKEAPRWLWQDRVGPALWTIASLISLSVNIVLIVMLIVLGRQLFALKGLVSEQLIKGLNQNFALMDQSHIRTNILVQDEIPVMFDLPVVAETTVTLTEDTRIRGVNINLRTGGLSISNAPANITLPAGARLPIALELMVPVSNTVPVVLNVPVDIPLDQTELHVPFIGLQEVITPYQELLTSLPNSWQETRFCQLLNGWLCGFLLGAE